MSALDMAYSISSLLEAPHHLTLLNDMDDDKDQMGKGVQMGDELGKENINNTNTQ